MENLDVKNRHIYRLPPCPAYDVEGMESWLSDMAQQGWFLAKEGFFAGIATFDEGEPRRVKYRLEAAQKNTSMWSDDGGEPDPDQIELSKKYSWTYVAKRRDFYIYRSFDPGARELNTDPEVQALALNAVKKRFVGTALGLVFWCIIYPLLLLRAGLFLTIINLKTWVFLMGSTVILLSFIDLLTAFVSLSKLQKKLRNDGALAEAKDWKKRTSFYHVMNAVQIVLIVMFIFVFLRSLAIMDEKVQLGNYDGEIPFATMQDFAEGVDYSYHMTMHGLSKGFNTIREWSDWLAPRNIDYNEIARITLPDGKSIAGGLYVDFHDTVSPFIAKMVAMEYYNIDKRKRDFQLIEIPDLNVDYAVAYQSTLHFPTLVIQHGNVVIHAYFYQTSDNYFIETDQWAKLIADSLKTAPK